MMDSFTKAVLTIVLCLYLSTVCSSLPSNKSNSFEISIIHFSDFHARFIPISPSGGLCYAYERTKCVGGIARVVTIVRRLKEIRHNAILLNAGDYFQGTLHYAIHRDNITAYFMNKLPHDAMTIGNHDFDGEISGLVSYMKNLRAPVVVTNIDQSNEPSMQNLFTNSTLIRKGGKDIGVIGVTFSDTDKISSTTGNLKFFNEVETVNLEAKKLKARGVNIIIVLSHCGIEHDKIIANNCPDVDVIVGGHSHILLYNGKPPSNEIAYDKYPIVITQKESNRKVLIVHASSFTKYVGDISIVFDDKDEVAKWKGNPIYLDELIKEDPVILKELQPWTVDIDKIGKRVIGETRTFLNGSCSSGECTLGDLITDAMVDKYVNNATISFMSANSIQNSIPVGSILYEDIYMSLPYNNTWDLIELQGRDLLQFIEDNVAVSPSNARFINFKLVSWSGLKVTYNLRKEHSKVVSVKVRCLKCEDRKYEDVNMNEWYRIVVPSYLLTKAFKTIAEKHRNHISGKTPDIENLIDYIRKIKVVKIKKGERMIFM